MKKRVIFVITTAFCLLLATIFSGCDILFGGDDIAEVRERVNKRRYEISETIISAFIEKNAEPIKALMCPMSQELIDPDEQILDSFSFMEGNIASYKIAGDTSGEGFDNDYGTITDYYYINDIFITTDMGRRYRLWFHDRYITDERIKGITQYCISEADKEDYIKRIYVSCGWSSPYDKECGILSAQIIKALASKDAAAIKTVLCRRAANEKDIDSGIQAAFDLFEGNPLFTEREDGIYRTYDNEGKEFTCRALGYECEKDDGGNEICSWVSIIVQTIYTDAGNRYTLNFVAYLTNENSDIVGVSAVELEDADNDVCVTFGEWIHEE